MQGLNDLRRVFWKIRVHCFTQPHTTLHYTTLHYIASNYITVHHIHTTQSVHTHTQLTHTYSSTHDLIILNQHQSVTISFLFPAFPLPSLGLSSQCCSRHVGKNGLPCAVLLLGCLAHLVLECCRVGSCALDEIDVRSSLEYWAHWWYQGPQFTTACCVSYVYILLVAIAANANNFIPSF